MSKESPAAATGARERPPAMTDVAKRAGVSHQTVSRVLNDVGPVHPDTRARVNAAIAELGYRRNSAARTLVTGRSQTLGVISFESMLYGPAATLTGIERAVRDAGYFVSIVSIHSLDKATVLKAAERLISQSVEGIMVVAPMASAARAIRELPASLPVVLLHAGAHKGIPVVTVDHERGARLATQHLLDLGHSSVWHIAGPEGWAESRNRQKGWAGTLAAAQAGRPPVIAGDWSADSGYEAGKVLAKKRVVTAIFAANDQMALGVLRALSEAGRRVPEDVSVVGFDDIPEAAYLIPPLTTVRQDFAEVGRLSLGLLLAQSGREHVGGTVVVEPELVVRSSTARVAAIGRTSRTDTSRRSG